MVNFPVGSIVNVLLVFGKLALKRSSVRTRVFHHLGVKEPKTDPRCDFRPAANVSSLKARTLKGRYLFISVNFLQRQMMHTFVNPQFKGWGGLNRRKLDYWDLVRCADYFKSEEESSSARIFETRWRNS